MDEPLQQELPLLFPDLSVELPLLPASMIAEFQYCPRLAYMQWVQKEWTETSNTITGKMLHRRVDKQRGKLPSNPRQFDEFEVTSVELSSSRLGLVARLDLLEGDGGFVVPVEYKRGKRPDTPLGSNEPERIQLMVQGLLLRDHGYRCDEGVIYYAGSKDRVRVIFDEVLIANATNAIEGLRFMSLEGKIPPPLQDSPKCSTCSLVTTCLPDEVNYLADKIASPRAISVKVEESLPVYVQVNGAKVSKSGDTLIITSEDTDKKTVRINEVSQLVLMGNVYITTPCLHELMRREIPVSWHSYGGWFLGHSVGLGHKNVELRTAQYQASFDQERCLMLAKGIVRNKINNCRTMLRRNWKADASNKIILAELKKDLRSVNTATDLQSLLGIEGAAAARYFGCFSNLIKSREDTESFAFDFTRRARRPPPDPVNALLSYAYTVLVRQWSVTLTSVGLDPYRGFYHQPRYGRPALALDLMEPFRPLIADSAVLAAINGREVRPTDFTIAGDSVGLSTQGRKRFLGVKERRLSQEIVHPLFGYAISYRRILEVQARLLSRYLLGEIEHYPDFVTR